MEIDDSVIQLIKDAKSIIENELEKDEAKNYDDLRVTISKIRDKTLQNALLIIEEEVDKDIVVEDILVGRYHDWDLDKEKIDHIDRLVRIHSKMDYPHKLSFNKSKQTSHLRKILFDIEEVLE